MKFALPKINSEKIRTLSKKFFQDKNEKLLLDLLELEIENPQDMRVKEKIAELYYKQDKTDEAVAKYREMAQGFEKENFVLKSVKACKNILKIKPNYIQCNLDLASLYLKMNLLNEAANQYRIAVNYFASQGNAEKTIALSQKLVKIDPSNDNRAKMAEIYQAFGMTQEAVQQYEILAQNYRTKKDFGKLLHYYELILPHQPENKAVLKDVCILHLRNQRPDRALQIMDHYKVLKDPKFDDLFQKAKLMEEAIKRHPKK